MIFSDTLIPKEWRTVAKARFVYNRRDRTYWRVYLPASMLACGSELRFNRRITIFALDLGSDSSASACSSSTVAASIRPSILAICVDLTIMLSGGFVKCPLKI